MGPISSIPVDVTRWFSTAEVAKAIGVTKRTLLQWIYDGLLKEPRRVRIAGVNWRIWSDADIARARKVKATMRRGPKPKRKKT